MRLHYLQQLYTYLFCVLYHHSFHLSLESRVTVKVSSLPPQTTTDEIEAYFEKQGDNIEVLTTVNFGNGNARVELLGLTSEGIFEHCFFFFHFLLFYFVVVVVVFFFTSTL